MSRVHLVNPSSQSFGVGIITPRWLDVLAAATGSRCGDGDVIWPGRCGRFRGRAAADLRRWALSNGTQRSARWARWIGHACRRLFLGKPMPDLALPGEFEPAINQG